MCFIINDEGKIDVTKEGMQLLEVQALYKTDKREGKSFFKKCITYVFYVYNPDGIYKNMLPRLKRKKVCDTYIGGDDPKSFEDNKLIQDVIKIYIDTCTTPTERLILGVNADIDELLQRIKDIPYVRKHKIDVDLEDGKVITKMVEVDNSEEKGKAIMLALKLVDYQEALKKKLRIEKDDSKKKDEEVKRLFE